MDPYAQPEAREVIVRAVGDWPTRMRPALTKQESGQIAQLVLVHLADAGYTIVPPAPDETPPAPGYRWGYGWGSRRHIVDLVTSEALCGTPANDTEDRMRRTWAGHSGDAAAERKVKALRKQKACAHCLTVLGTP